MSDLLKRLSAPKRLDELATRQLTLSTKGHSRLMPTAEFILVDISNSFTKSPSQVGTAGPRFASTHHGANLKTFDNVREVER